jgi:hypothetical protein
MLNTDELKTQATAKAQELLKLFQDNGYDSANVEINAYPAAYGGNREVFVYEDFDWTPSASNWDASSC